MESGAVMILVVIISICHKIDAELNVIPRDTEVKINDSAFMNCSTSLQANQVQWFHGNKYVYTGIAILEPYIERFSVEMNASTGACNLVIRSVQPSDAGQYKCVDDEGLGQERSAHLIVLDAGPVCESNMNSNGVIGPNSCDIEPDIVKLSCSTTFHGNIPPVFRWISSGYNKTITDGRFNVTSINNEVTYTLTIKSALTLNNCSFVCQTTRTSDKPYSCSSNAINILYVFSSEVSFNTTMDDEVICSANSSQSCSYKWKWFRGEDSTTESDNRILKPKKGGWHRCEASCSFGDRSCTVQSMHVKVHSDDASGSRNRLPLLALLLVPAVVGLLGVFIYHRRSRQSENSEHETELQRQRLLEEQNRELEREREREQNRERINTEHERMLGRYRKRKQRSLIAEKRKLERQQEREQRRLNEIEKRNPEKMEPKPEKEEDQRLLDVPQTIYKSDPFLVHTIKTIAAKRNSNGLTILAEASAEEVQDKEVDISGLTILDNELFVVHEKTSEVEVYDSISFSFSRQWNLKELIDPLDIASCKRNKCLYISDYKDKEILRVDPNGKLIKKWSTGDDWGHGLSVTVELNVILTVSEKNKLNEYSPDGQFIREINLLEAGVKLVNHSIKLTNGHFLVSYGDEDTEVHEVCIVDTDGNLKKSFGGKRGFTIGQLFCPVYVAVDGNGFVMVADLMNHRVLLLDSDLKFKREILSDEINGLQYPYRILLDESNDRLFVADNDLNNLRILIFNFKKTNEEFLL